MNFSLRVLVAALSAIAATAQVLRFAHSGHLVNGLSLFTIQSNAIAIVALLISPSGAWFRGAATTYISVTGVMYTLFLSGGNPLFVSPDNAMLHYAMPIAMWYDWIKSPKALSIHPAALIGTWLVYPLIYLTYTYARGPMVHWYPYGFVNPSIGPLALTGVLLGILALTLALANAVIATGRVRATA